MMGCQIQSDNEEICFTAGAWTVVNWCDCEWWKDGSIDIEAEDVIKADRIVPDTFDLALAGGYLKPISNRAPIDKDGFRQCRQFLRNTARAGGRITGSY